MNPRPHSDIIAIHVGARSKRTTFSAERQMLMSQSSYFRSLLSDTEIKEIEWIEMDPVIVEGILDWMRDGTLGPLAIPPETSIAQESSYTDRLLNAYREGRIISLCGFQNEISDHIRTTLRNQNQWPAVSLLPVCYWKGLRNEPVTKLFMRCLVWQLRHDPAKFIAEKAFTEGLLKYPEVMQDLGAALVDFGRVPWGYPCEETAQEQICVYHNHSDGSACGGLGPRSVEIGPPPYASAR